MESVVPLAPDVVVQIHVVVGAVGIWPAVADVAREDFAVTDMTVGLDVVGGVTVGADHLIVLALQDVVDTTAVTPSFAHTHELGGALDGAQGARIIEHVIGA